MPQNFFFLNIGIYFILVSKNLVGTDELVKKLGIKNVLDLGKVLVLFIFE